VGLHTETNWWKAKWVVKGYRQVEGINYNKTHAAVAHKDTHRVFLLFVNHFDLQCIGVNKSM
jgi:hypothetical protein